MSNESSSRFVIRDARADDLAVIVEFNRRLAFETEAKVLDLSTLAPGVERALADPERLRYWVAEAGEPSSVVAQAAVTREWSDWRNGWVWWFQSVYVAAEWRGQGLFRGLHKQIRAEAHAQPDVIGLRLYVEQENFTAKTTYESLGMKAAGYLVYEDLWIPSS